jgi:iron(III) transport system ATP-binding protein
VSRLTVRGLEKSFGTVRVLRGLDLDVAPGSLAAVLGPSGCGKTTLLRVVAGFERPDDGTVELDGTVVASPSTSIPPERRRVGIVPQEGALFPHLSVAANVGYGLRRRDRPGRRGGRVDDVLELVGLADFGERMPHELSGGQQQRVALARALAPEPALVLLDEPFSALDTGLRAAVRDDVQAALRAAGQTAVLVTHDQQEALSMADSVAVMRDGLVVQAASPSDLYAAPVDAGVATFVGEAMVVDADLRDGRAWSRLGNLAVRDRGGLRDGPGRVVVRPEQVVLGPMSDGLPARICSTVFYGHDALVRLQLADGAEVLARTQGPLPVELANGGKVGVRVVGEVAFFPR